MTVKATRADAELLTALLRGKGFRKARNIGMIDRKIRATCSAFPDRFVSTQAGYCLVDEAKDDEIENAIADLRSRVKQINKRATALEAVMRNRKNYPIEIVNVPETLSEAQDRIDTSQAGLDARDQIRRSLGLPER